MRTRIYKHKRKAGPVIAGIIRVVAVLAILAVVLFFLLRSWTVYDDAGSAHIRFPWSQAVERAN